MSVIIKSKLHALAETKVVFRRSGIILNWHVDIPHCRLCSNLALHEHFCGIGANEKYDFIFILFFKERENQYWRASSASSRPFESRTCTSDSKHLTTNFTSPFSGKVMDYKFIHSWISTHFQQKTPSFDKKNHCLEWTWRVPNLFYQYWKYW